MSGIKRTDKRWLLSEVIAAKSKEQFRVNVRMRVYILTRKKITMIFTARAVVLAGNQNKSLGVLMSMSTKKLLALP